MLFYIILQGIEYYDNMKRNFDELRTKHRLGPAAILQMMQERHKD